MSEINQQDALTPENNVTEVASEPENQMVESENETSFGADEVQMQEQQEQLQEQQEPDWFQKRINGLTAQKKAAQEEADSLKQKVADLESRLNERSNDSSNEKELSQAEINQAYQKAFEENDFALMQDINNYIIDNKIKAAKNEYKTQSEEQMRIAESRAKEWNTLINQYGKYGLNDKNSKLYVLSEAIYKQNPEAGQSMAVASAFREMAENNSLQMPGAENVQQKLIKERRRNSLNSGLGTGGSSETEPAPKTAAQSHEDYIQQRIRQSIAVSGL